LAGNTGLEKVRAFESIGEAFRLRLSARERLPAPLDVFVYPREMLVRNIFIFSGQIFERISLRKTSAL